jgi:hypothetical protein
VSLRDALGPPAEQSSAGKQSGCAAAGTLTSLRYHYLWSFSRENAEMVAMNTLTDLVTPDEVEHIEVVER